MSGLSYLSVIPPSCCNEHAHSYLPAEHEVQEYNFITGIGRSRSSGARSDNYFERCLHCLSHVPCSSLIAWIALLLGLGGMTGSLLIASYRTRELLEDERMLWFVEYMVIGVTVGMFCIGTCWLVVGHFSSEPNNRHVFNTSGKNACARGLNIFILVLNYTLCLAWIFASAIFIIPVTALVLLIYLREYKHSTCINLQNYGFNYRDICNENLERFTSHGRDLLICYVAAYVSSVIIILSLVHFLMCTSANITHLRDARFATLTAYEEEEEPNAKQMNDTTM